MRITCLRDYNSPAVSYKLGQSIDLDDTRAKFLLVNAPKSFEIDLTAMSTETQTGLVAPDRRGRGGRKR